MKVTLLKNKLNSKYTTWFLLLSFYFILDSFIFVNAKFLLTSALKGELNIPLNFNLINYYNGVYSNIFIIILITFIFVILTTNSNPRYSKKLINCLSLPRIYVYIKALDYDYYFEFSNFSDGYSVLTKPINSALTNQLVVIHPIIVQMFYSIVLFCALLHFF